MRRSYKELAEEATKNFRIMTDRMASIANGNDETWSRHWPEEEGLFPPLWEYLKKNNDLIKELKEMKND